MLRIITGFLLLIISQICFAETIPADVSSTITYQYVYSGVEFKSMVLSDVCTGIAEKRTSEVASHPAPYNSVTSESEIAGNLAYCSFYYSNGGRWGGFYINKITDNVYSCPSGYYHSDSSGSYNSEGAFCSSCAQSSKQNLTDLYLTGSTAGCYQECSFKFAATAEATATLAAGGQVFAINTARCSTIDYGTGSPVKRCTGPMLEFSGSSCEPAMSSAAVGASVVVDESTAEIDMTNGSCPNGVSTGQFNGSRVIYCKSADSSAESESDSDTETGSGGDSGSGSESEDEGSESGDNGGTSGGSSSSDNPDDPSTCDTEDAQADCAGTGSGGSFSTPAKGKDYFADLFGAADLQALADKKTAIQNSISAKKTEIKGVFNFTGISMSGSMSENTQEIKGASIDLSGKSTFDRFTYIAAILYYAAVIIAIWIILGGKK